MSNDGTGLTQITTTTAHDTQPAWSPDGTKIAFSSDRNGLFQIFTMNPGDWKPDSLSGADADSEGATV